MELRSSWIYEHIINQEWFVLFWIYGIQVVILAVGVIALMKNKKKDKQKGK